MSEIDLTGEVNTLGLAPRLTVLPNYGVPFASWVRLLWELAVDAPELGYLDVEEWKAPELQEWWCRDCRRRIALDTHGLCLCGSQAVEYIGG